MKNRMLLAIAFLLLLHGGNLDAQESAAKANTGDQEFAAIKKVMSEQVASWNKGDLDSFMKGYWKSEKLTFSAGGKTTRGWQQTLDNYKKSYPREKMGQLKFSNFEFTLVAPNVGLVLGQWHLDDKGTKKGGNFSLVFKKFDGEWLIIHDHSSSLEEKTEKK